MTSEANISGEKFFQTLPAPPRDHVATLAG